MDKGAHFYRCDFQVHTPRDQNWKGKDVVSIEERAAYAKSLVSYCRIHDLHAIAITDHHDMAFVPYVIKAAAAETDDNGETLPPGKRLIVFPGIELTLGVPCQAILLLDADFPENMFVPLLTALHLNPPADEQPRNGNVVRLDDVHSFLDLKQQLDRHNWLKDKYIIFPNVSGEGECSLLRQGQMGKYIEMPCVGGYVDGLLSKLKPGRKSIIDGYDKSWGNKRIACFQTSDNRHDDHRCLGTCATWVKWATPTAEALRQACLAQESRVSQEAPVLPALVIASISVSNSLFLGPVDLELNPQYNAMIGGRGTGKSTILEYLRWALCDQPPGIEDVETPNYQARRHRLIEQTLKPLAATVEVRFEVNGVPHTVRRSSVDGSILLKIATGDMRPCAEDEIRSLLPIEAYSQKQLSDVSVRIDELTRFVTAPIRSELNRIDRELADNVERIRQSYATRRRQRTLEQTTQKRKLEAKSLAEQADALRAGLTGLSEGDRALLDRGKLFDAANQSVESWKDGVKSIRQGAASLQRTASTFITHLVLPSANPPSAALEAAHAEYRALLDETKAVLNTLLEKSARLLAAPDGEAASTPWQQWAMEFTTFKASYDAAVRTSSSHTEGLKQLQFIEAQALKLNREVTQLKEELRALSETEASYLAERQAWKELLNERDTLFDAQCASLTTNSGQAIRARVKRFASADDFTNIFRQALTGSRLQSNKIELLGASIVTALKPDAHWNTILNDLEKLAEHDPERDGAERRPETPTLVSIGLSSGDLDRIGRTLKPEQWLSLSLTPIKSVPIFEYQSREAEYIPFSNASAGQQATALLETLLTQGTFPLIIDQPEEDLDNPVMIEIVTKIWQAKQRRQIIFASHNANLVVNGDAELVAWCNYRALGDQSRGTIGGTGAIDMPDVREAIKKIMEGGEAAFRLRREKYGF